MEGFLLFGIVVWLILISFFVFKIWSHYNSLVARTDKRQLSQILDDFVKEGDLLKNDLKVIKKHLEEVDGERLNYLKKTAIVRFNPFKGIDNGQSFVLALLNEKRTGLVINFIYTKDGLRVYAKKIKEGRGMDYQLSAEEKEAVGKIS